MFGKDPGLPDEPLLTWGRLLSLLLAVTTCVFAFGIGGRGPKWLFLTVVGLMGFWLPERQGEPPILVKIVSWVALALPLFFLAFVKFG